MARGGPQAAGKPPWRPKRGRLRWAGWREGRPGCSHEAQWPTDVCDGRTLPRGEPSNRVWGPRSVSS